MENNKNKKKNLTRWIAFFATIAVLLFFFTPNPNFDLIPNFDYGEEVLKGVVVFTILVAAIKLVEIILIKKWSVYASKTKNKIDDAVVFVVKKSMPFLYIGAFYIGLYQLKFLWNVKYAYLIVSSLKVLVSVYVIYMAIILMDWFEQSLVNEGKSELKIRSLKGAVKILKIVVYSFGIVLILGNLGVNVTALITGLGITGIAVALAAQKILEDLFNYFVIILDKPFDEGDFITYGNYAGTVKFIGIKSTRIRSLSGEEIVVSNTNLLGENIQNYKRMKKRRVVFKIGVVYETPIEKLKKIPDIVKGIIDDIEGVEFDRCHFINFSDFSLDFETVYYVEDSDYLHYMNVQQKINLALVNQFGKEGIEFAYPTQVVYLNRGEENEEK